MKSEQELKVDLSHVMGATSMSLDLNLGELVASDDSRPNSSGGAGVNSPVEELTNESAPTVVSSERLKETLDSNIQVEVISKPVEGVSGILRPPTQLDADGNPIPRQT